MLQIYNWLANSPSEMESYIRPGCVVLSVYVSMSYVAWEQVSMPLHPAYATFSSCNIELTICYLRVTFSA